MWKNYVQQTNIYKTKTENFFSVSRFFFHIIQFISMVVKRKGRKDPGKAAVGRLSPKKVISCGRTCSRCTDPRWGWPRGCPPGSSPESSSWHRHSGKRTAWRCTRCTCWHCSSWHRPPFLNIALVWLKNRKWFMNFMHLKMYIYNGKWKRRGGYSA